jgi:hypothetical protein
MFIPARKERGPVEVCTRMPRLLSVATAGAVSVGAAFGLAPGAAADPPPDQRVSVVVDIVGDSYMTGEGVRDAYLDPADPRHRSLAAPALQALSRLVSDNSRLRVDANIVAASGAETTNFFSAQKGPDDIVVNPPQRDQLRPGAQLVIVNLGGEDARLATVLADAKRTANGPNVVLDKQIKELGPLLDSAASDGEYFTQATSSPPGRAPTLVARMMQVLAGIRARAPHATIVVTNYPLAADPQNKHAASLVGEDELTTVRKFSYDLNKAIERAVQICRCAFLVDVSGAVAGHEAYTDDSAFDERSDQQAPRERFRPNQKGASLIANPIASGVASLLRITPPKPSDGRVTVPKNIAVHAGVSDRDGDRVPDSRDRAPDDPTRAQDAPKAKHAPVAGERPSRQPSKPKPSSGNRHAPAVVSQVIPRVVTGLAPVLGQARPTDRHAPVPAPATTAQARTGDDTDRRPAGTAVAGRAPADGPGERRPAVAPATTEQAPAEPQRRPGVFRAVPEQVAGESDRSRVPEEAAGDAGQAPAAGADDNRRVVSVRELFARTDRKKSRPADTPTTLTPPAVTPKPEDQATPRPADKRVDGTETSQRKPQPADAGPKRKPGRGSAPAAPDVSGQTNDDSARPGGQFVEPTAAGSAEPEGMVP